MRRYLHGNIKKTPCGVFFHSDSVNLIGQAPAHFRAKAAARREIRRFNISDKPECGGKRRKEIQKPSVFGGVLSPISFAAERNGAAGGKKAVGGRYHERRGAGSALILHTSGKFLLFPLFSWSETFPPSGAEFARKWQSLAYMSSMLTTSEFLFDFISTKFMKMVLP